MNKTLITIFTVLFCLTSSISWSLEYKDLVVRDGVSYKKFSDIPFTGEVTGQEQGSFKNGKKDGSYKFYSDNGQLWIKIDYKNGKKEGSWVSYYENRKLWEKGKYKNEKKEGTWVHYYRNGQLEYKRDHKNGLFEGSVVGEWRDATINEIITGTYKDGKKISD